jgi:hypothetical protein
MIPQDIEKLVKKYPNNYELGEEVRKFYYKKKDEKNSNSGIIWVGILFLFIFASLLTWIITA